MVASALATSAVGWADACVDSTLAVYDAAGFSCSIGPLIFSNFSYTNTNVPAVPPSDAQVTVVPYYALGVFEGLAFYADPDNWTGGGPGVTDTYAFDYVVSAAPGFSLGTVFVLELRSGGRGGSGLLSETFAGGPTLDLPYCLLCQEVGGFDFGSSTDISTTLTLVGPESFSNLIIEYFSSQSAPPVPEPASFALLGTALVGTAILLRRKLHDGSRPK